MFRPADVLHLIILMVSDEAFRNAVLSNLLSFFLLLSEHFPQHNVLKHTKTTGVLISPYPTYFPMYFV